VSLHREVFTNLVETQGWTRGAELGVDKGILFGMLLKRCPDLRLIGVDTFPDRERSHRAFELSAAEGRRAELLVMTTSEAAPFVEDGSQDFVFIDADHGYEAVKEDIARWRAKVRPGGWLGGHDYNRKFPGVIAAVVGEFGTKVRQWPGSIWGVWC
jgi:predicted O-methyltransferase YrrM